MSTKDTPRVTTIILNTNRRDDTLACLQSLLQNDYPRHRIIVLDNASTDGSRAAIEATFAQVEIISLTRNRGYAGNNNVGISAALEQETDWVFILNEDTLLDAGCIAELVRVAEQDPQIGIVGPMVYHHDEPGVIQSAGGQLDSTWQAWHLGQNEPDRGQFPRPHDVAWISGCAILVRRAVIDQVGALDERFYYYWEETEWCLRAARQGWRIVHVPAAKLWHKGVQRNYEPSPSVTYYNTRNRLLFMRKHGAPLRAWLPTWRQLGQTLISWTVRPKWRAKQTHRDALWQGAIDFLWQRWGVRS